MKRSAATALAVLTSAVLCLPAGGTAAAATVDIGAVAEIRANTPPDPMTAGAGANTWMFQLREAAGTYAVPAGYGVITGWSHRTGATPGELTFKVYRPTSVPDQFLTLAANPRTVSANTIHDFPVRIPVQPGDRIGISTTTVEVAYNTGNPADQMGTFDFRQPDPAPGTTAPLDGPPFMGYRVDVAARVETDADGDGFGDTSQDGCPTSAATSGPCPGTVLPAFAGCPSLSANVIRGTTAANSITGTLAGDRIFSGAGNDTVDGAAGDDCLDLGAGADRGQGGSGRDLMLGGAGTDRISGSSGDDRLRGGSSEDRLLGGFGDDALTGESGSDRLSGSRGRDRVSGGSGNDVISAGSSGDRVAGGAGNDRINGNSGRDRISGGGGNDRINARDGQRDRISCGRGRDRVGADRRDRVARDCERAR